MDLIPYSAHMLKAILKHHEARNIKRPVQQWKSFNSFVTCSSPVCLSRFTVDMRSQGLLQCQNPSAPCNLMILSYRWLDITVRTKHYRTVLGKGYEERL